MADSGQGASDKLDMERLRAAHRGALRGYWLYAALLVVAGVGLLILTFLGTLPWLIGLLTGIMALAVSVLPMRQAAERQERLQGLDVLEDDWSEIQRSGDAGMQEQFMALMRRLYGKS